MRRLRWARHVACMRGIRNSYRILIRKPERKRPLVRIRHCGNLPQCKTDNSHRVAKEGDIYILQIVAWP
jgi:hypothetical protein